MVYSSVSASDCFVRLFSVTFAFMEPAFESEVVGVDILLYPGDDAGVAPSPSEVPLPSFGCQGIDIPMSTQESSGRDIPGTSPVEQVKKDDRKCPLEESSSSSSRSCTPEVASEDSDRSVEHRPKPKTGTRTPRGSVGQALQEKRRRQNMLGAVELCDSVMQVEASSAEDTSDVSVLYDMADKAVSIATFRQTEQVSLPAAASSFVCLRHLRHLLLLQVPIALPQHLRNMQGTLFLLPVVRTCIQSSCYLEWWVVQSVSSSKAGRIVSSARP